MIRRLSVPCLRRCWAQLPLVCALVAAAAALALPARAQDRACDELVLYNGKIVTLDARNTIASSVVIRGGQITAIAAARGIPRHDACARLLDLRGHTAIPGLVDSHEHFVTLSQRPGFDTRLDTTTSIAEVQDALRRRAKTAKPGAWITAVGGWNPVQLAEKRLPTLAELDAAAPNHPVLLFPGLNGPSATNTPGKAFLEAKIIAVSADGLIAAANPSMAALDAIRALETSDDLRRTALEVTNYALSFGVTTHDDQAGGAPPFNCAPGPQFGSAPIWRGLLEIAANSSALDPFTGYDHLLALHRQGKLPARLRLFFYSRDLQPDLPFLTQRLNNQFLDFGDDGMRVSGIGEWVSTGDLRNPPPIYENAVRLIAQRGWRYNQHTNGPEDQRAIAGVWEKVNAATPIASLRWDMDHAVQIDADTLRRLKALGAGVSASGGYFVEVPGRVAPLRAILESGVHFGYGSDGGSVAPLAPWLHMYYMVTGKNAAGVVVNPGQTLTRLQALRAFTIDNAWFTGDEDKLGSIEVGKFGDVAILGDDFLDPARVPDDAIKHLSSVMTILGGKIVFDSGALAPHPASN
jgi:predicted amidohydrolase YtcJ